MVNFAIVFCVFFQASISLFAQEKEIIIRNGEVEIGGTLFFPDSETDGTLVILISGSGPQDRDESIVGFKPFKVIAEHLVENGISSYRFDDRGVGKSTGVFNDATLQIMASDVGAIISHFKESSEHSYSEFILLGHSQGGMVGAKAATQNKDVTHLILMASPIVSLKDVISEQIVVMQKAIGKTDEDLEPTLAFQEKVYAAVRTDEGWDEVRENFKELINAELAKLPEAQQAYITDRNAFAEAQFTRSIDPIKTLQMRSLLFYDSGNDIESLNIPILGIFGGKDTQVTVKQNGRRLDEICSSKENCVSITFEDANHLFQKAQTGLPMEYATLSKEFVVGFLSSISSWILNYQ
ncbi:MAG: alpha/beta hydrolase [Balneolaceae bacterium]